jgi:hypothetical protein
VPHHTKGGTPGCNTNRPHTAARTTATMGWREAHNPPPAVRITAPANKYTGGGGRRGGGREGRPAQSNTNTPHGTRHTGANGADRRAPSPRTRTPAHAPAPPVTGSAPIASERELKLVITRRAGTRASSLRECRILVPHWQRRSTTVHTKAGRERSRAAARLPTQLRRQLSPPRQTRKARTTRAETRPAPPAHRGQRVRQKGRLGFMAC